MCVFVYTLTLTADRTRDGTDSARFFLFIAGFDFTVSLEPPGEYDRLEQRYATELYYNTHNDQCRPD